MSNYIYIMFSHLSIAIYNVLVTYSPFTVLFFDIIGFIIYAMIVH